MSDNEIVIYRRGQEHSIQKRMDLPPIVQLVVLDDGGKISTCRELHIMRMLTYPEISRLIRNAGFLDVKCFGDFSGLAEAEDKAERLILVCKKACPRV